MPIPVSGALLGKVPIFLSLAVLPTAWSASFYSQRLDDPKAVYVTPSTNGDDTAGLQAAVNRVQETTGQGIVLLAPGRYTLTNTIYIWPGIRLIGYGPDRPVIALRSGTPGFGDASREKIL
ncbi:MAG TPA: glycosyl hydrolase family 28-related protein, partial [Candidatus Acidoferrales bacterium]|nr:glycosyl hydrolase family 28-related protein [Candidatus Acidoferrales bacterium]